MKRNSALQAVSMGIATLAMMASVPVTTAHAATTGYYNYHATGVEVNGSVVSTPGHIVAKDPFSGGKIATSFLPVWYVDQALGKFGVKVTWSGATGILNLTTPSGMKVNYPSTPRAIAINSGTMKIEINGKVVTYAPRIAYYDEGSNGIITTFVPVYYLEKSLGYMGVQTGWTGTYWTMNYGAVTTPPPTGTSVKLAAAIAFAKAMNIKPNNTGADPYSDVPQSDWQWIEPLVNNNFVYKLSTEYGGGFQVQMGTSVFQPESSTQFGSNVTMAQIDRAFQVASGWKTGHDAYLPGGSVTAFGNVVGVNNGLPSSGNLSMSDVGTLSENLAKIEKGMVSLGNNQYQLVYRPQAAGNYWTAAVPANVFAANEAKGIQMIDQTVITYLGGNNFETKAPDVSESSNFTVSGIDTPEQYSLDGGKTWHTASGAAGFDSSDPSAGGTNNPPSTVLIKDTQGGGGIMVYAKYNGNWQTAAGGGISVQNGTISPSYQ